MIRSGFGRHTLGPIAAAALLAACGGTQPPIGAPDAMPLSSVHVSRSPRVVRPQYRTGAAKYRVVFSFGENAYAYDGAGPEASLINVNGTLCGTTSGGGTYKCRGVDCGTVFSVGTTGTENVLHDFSGTPDGNFPFAGLVDMNGILYGTTANGGTYGYGTVFSITASGTETVLHSFGEGYANDGVVPEAGLIDVNGTLYGTTSQGGISLPSCPYSGPCDWGTVYAFKP
jgi:uncharacterized repeat protein (TIGR03803 family)